MLVHELAIMSQLQHHDYMPPLPALMAQCAVVDYQIRNVLLSAKTCWSMVADDKTDARIMHLLTLIKANRFWHDGHDKHDFKAGWRMYCYQWGRDCDQCESDRMYMIPATLDAFLTQEDDIYDEAEGPTSFYIVSEADHEGFEPTFRDRRAEQYGY